MHDASGSRDLDAFQEILEYRFRDPDLLRLALRHASASGQGGLSNERLEFLGDAVLGLVVSDWLHSRQGPLDEGLMTKARANVVSKKSLRVVAGELGIIDHLVIGPMFRDRSEIGDATLADAVEALIAAIYLDAGLEAARRFVLERFRHLLERVLERPGRADFKSRLGQWAQKRRGINPEYRVEGVVGPDHERTWTVSVLVDGRLLGSASGVSKKRAEQEAARLALETLRSEPDEGFGP